MEDKLIHIITNLLDAGQTNPAVELSQRNNLSATLPPLVGGLNQWS